MIENMRYAMKRISRIIVFALLVAMLIGCSNNPNSGNSGIILPGGPGFPVSNPFKDDAIEITGTVIDSLDHQTIFNEFRTALKRLFDPSQQPDNPQLDHSGIEIFVDGEPYDTSKLSGLIQNPAAGVVVLLTDETAKPYISDALNKVIIGAEDQVVAKSTITFKGYESGLHDDSDVLKIESGNVDIAVAPRVMLLDFTKDSAGLTVITVKVLGNYSFSTVTGSPIKASMKNGESYDISFTDLSGFFTVSADIVGSKLLAAMTDDGTASIEEAINNTAGRLYLPSADETTKITVSGEGDSASFAWNELAASNFGSKNAIGPSADILESADILPFMTGFGSVRLINSLDRAMTADDGTDSETDTGTLKIKNYDKLAVEGNELVFELELEDYAYSTVVSEDATMSSLTITATGPQKKATGTATLTLTGTFDSDSNVFTATGYSISANGLQLKSDYAKIGVLNIETAVPQGTLSIDVSGEFEGKTVKFTLEGKEKGITDANDPSENNPAHNTAFAGLFENITSMNVSGSVTADFESLSKVLELLG